MVRNIVFDMGGVLMRFEPMVYISREIADPAQQQLVYQELFHSVEWAQLDRGSLDFATALDRVCARLPQPLHQPTRRIFAGWYQSLAVIPGMETLAKRLHQAGYRLYLLSNASLQFYDYYKRMGAVQYFTHLYLSADHQLLKPDPAIYRDFCQVTGTQPQECLFIDDLPINIEGAVFCGWQGIIAQGDAALLEQQLRAIGLTF